MRRLSIARERQLGEKIGKAAALLRERRMAEKLSQADLAKKLGVTANTIARWERCEVPIPQWVARLQAAHADGQELQTALAKSAEEKKKLRDTIDTQALEIKCL